MDGFIPARCLARARTGLALDRLDALAAGELKKRLAESWEMVVARLPKMTRDALQPG
jgi:hypothetical protein